MFTFNIYIHTSDFGLFRLNVRKLVVSEIFYIWRPRFDVCWGEPVLGPEYDCLGKLQQTHLLSGLRFSTAVWVWLVVRTETCSPSGPLAVEMTSYSVGRTANSLKGFIPGQKQCSSIPVVSLSDFSQSRMTKDGHPSTVTTVRLEGGERGGEVTFTSPGSSSGK